MELKAERIALVVGLTIVLILSWLKPMENVAEAQLDAGFKRALASYAVARTLNAAISVAQGTEVSFAPGGLGLNLTPGQILDPVNDMVEQFSDLMLAALVAFGIMKISISIGSFWLISLLLTVLAAGWVWFRWNKQSPPPMLTKILIMLLFVRFAIPMVTIGSDLVFKQFLADEYTESQDAISLSFSQIEAVKTVEEIDNKPEASADTNNEDKSAMQAETILGASGVIAGNNADEVRLSTLQKLKLKAAHVKEALAGEMNQVGQKAGAAWSSVKDRTQGLDKMKERAEQIVEHLVKLMVVFILQTILIPLVLLWAFVRIGRSAIK